MTYLLNVVVFSVCMQFVYADGEHFDPGLEGTGVSQLTIFEESITGLSVGDEVGIFDANGITNYGRFSRF